MEKKEVRNEMVRGDLVSVVRAEPPAAEVPMMKSGGEKQRWSRDAYNAYMREYMAKRREGEGVKGGKGL